MKRLSIILPFLLTLLPSRVFSQEVGINDTIQSHKTNNYTFNGGIELNSKGFAPVPAFSFNHLITMICLSVKKNRFSYEPDWAIGLNGKPWLIQNWLRYRFADKKRFNINAGINLFLFFQTETAIPAKERLDVNRNMAMEVSANYLFSPDGFATISYQFIHAFDDTPGGHFADLSYSFSNIILSKKIVMNAKAEFFYINFKGRLDGLFSSGKINIVHSSFPVSLRFQVVQYILINFPDPGFQGNYGLVWVF